MSVLNGLGPECQEASGAQANGDSSSVGIGPVVLRRRGEMWELRSTLTLSPKSYDVWFRIKGLRPSRNSDALLPIALLVAMARGKSIHSEDGISAQLQTAVPTIKAVYRDWWAGVPLDRVRVVAPKVRRRGPKGRMSAVFFSGGVDSFYAALKRIDEIDALIFVHGFDLAMENRTLRERVSRTVELIATEWQKKFVEVETNVREVLDEVVHWELSHGAALASVAHLVSTHCHRVSIPASHSYADLFPWGSHPLLDPLWSSEALSITHDGCEINRAERVAAISQSDVAMKYLRVCWRNTEESYNCGRCEKCLRTMISLLAIGALERCDTFPDAIDPENVAAMPIDALGIVAHALENLELLPDSLEMKPLREAIGNAVQRYSRTQGLWGEAFWNPFCFGGHYPDRLRSEGDVSPEKLGSSKLE